MSAEHGVAVWGSDDWRRRATAWADERLAPAGLARTGPPEVASLRPWAAVLRIPTSGGPVWLKATGPLVAFEAGLYDLLERVAPEFVLAPLAIDVERGLLLLPDGGRSLGDRAPAGPELVAGLAEALPRYAELQRRLAPHADELLALGVSDMRPGVMPLRFDEALTAARAYVDERGGPELRSALGRVADMRPTVVGWCERLAAGPIPAGLDHNDLHAWNILGGAGDGVRFYDWGDSVVAHPFASMLALGWVRMSPADLVRLRDAYLEPYLDLAPHGVLVEQLELACRVGKIARALTWQRSISPYGTDEVEQDWLPAPTEWLVSVLQDSWLMRG
jgi:hypothetical protein